MRLNMTTEEVKRWLNRGRMIDKEIKLLEAEYMKAKAAAQSTSCCTGDERVQTSRKNASEDKFAAVAEYSIMLDKRRAELCKIKAEILGAVNMVEDNVLRNLLFARYISAMTWEEVAGKLGYSYKHVVHILHPKALKKIKNVIECNILPVI